MITGFLCVSQVPQLLLTFGGWGSRLVVYAAFLLYKSDQIDDKEMSKNKEEKHSFPPFFPINIGTSTGQRQFACCLIGHILATMPLQS